MLIKKYESYLFAVKSVDVTQYAVFGGRLKLQHLFSSNLQSFYKTTYL